MSFKQTERIENPKEGSMQIKSVHHSLESIVSVLKRKEYKGLPEVQELLEVFNINYTKTGRDTDTNEKNQQRKPFIVLEGLDACGKTTVSRKLAAVLKGIKKASPPECLLPLRQKFDSHPMQLRRAYYGLGNYIAGHEAEVLCRDQPVVMDRYWHSTAVFGITQELCSSQGVSNMPPVGDSVYVWPEDLTKPDLILFLNVNEEARNKRHARRNTTNTVEEKALKEDEEYRSSVLEAYKRMDKPSIVEVDSNQSIEDVTQEIIKHINNVM